jgi:hypothetical protein
MTVCLKSINFGFLELQKCHWVIRLPGAITTYHCQPQQRGTVEHSSLGSPQRTTLAVEEHLAGKFLLEEQTLNKQNYERLSSTRKTKLSNREGHNLESR